MAPLSSCWLTFIFSFLPPSFFHFFLSFSLLFLFFFFLSLFLFLFLSFFFLLGAPFCDPGGPGPSKPLKIRPCLYGLFIHPSPYASYFSVLSSKKFQPTLQKVERCCLLTFLPYIFDFPLVKHPPMPCRLILCVSKTFWFLMPLLCWTQTIFTYSS